VTSPAEGSLTLPAFRRLAGAAALFTAAVGALVLSGWAVGGALVERAFRAGAAMLPSTTVAAVMAGAALWLLRERAGPRMRAAAQALAAGLVLLGALTLAERLLGSPLDLDALLFHDKVRRYGGLGQMGVNTATGLLLAGAALLLTARETRLGWRAGQLLALLGLLVAVLALVGHLYGASGLYTVSFTGGMALPTALALASLHAGVFFARPGRGYAALVTGDDASGVLARQLLPAAVFIPLALGWFWLHARRVELVDRTTAVSLFVLLIVALFVGLVFRAAAAVRDIDREREASLARERRARGEAEEANRAKMDFLAVMSHELRTPLNAIAGYAELLDMEIHGPVTPAQREALGKVRRSQRHLLLLINDVLNFAKLEAGRVEIRPAEVTVGELVAAVEPLILPQAQARGLTYERRLPDEPLAVRADPDKAGQVLLNLLSNAVKFTEPGGRVCVECEPNGRRVLLRVRDTGVGIPRERLESVFEPFVQLERGLTSSREGTGLGLAISRDLARAMGGDLHAESEPGKGSVFTLALPRAD
jgi:signal transduction histidine kinase